jgi:SOS-response transcriptional repressor LexA
MMHYALASDKCLLHQPARYDLIMVGPADRLKEARIRAGYDSAKSAAEAMGAPVATYIQHENGARGFPAARAERYARFFRVAPEWLLYGTSGQSRFQPLGPTLFVRGAVAAGVWRDAYEWPEEDWKEFTGRGDITASLKDRFGLEIVGDSMSLIYPHGSIVECVFGRAEIAPGKRVVIVRRRDDLEYEATVKELIDIDGVMWAAPRSHNPTFTAFRLDENEPGIIETRITAVVVASIRPE